MDRFRSGLIKDAFPGILPLMAGFSYASTYLVGVEIGLSKVAIIFIKGRKMRLREVMVER